MNCRALLTAAASLTITVLPLPGLVTPAAAQLTVFDPSNYSQTVLTAARTLQQVNNQIAGLQNQAAMLTNMAKQLQRLDFSSLQQLTQSMQRVDALMLQAEGISFDLASTDAALRDQFPQGFDTALSTSQIVAQARQQWQSAMQGYRQTMRVQAQVVENVQGDAPLLAQLVNRSQGAAGSLEAQQATNQLIALSAKQQFQIQSMMAAQYRADALERARQAQALEASRASTRTFIGSRSAYTPQ